MGLSILMKNILKQSLKFLLLIILIISFYIFVDVIILKNKTHLDSFSTWQFPMLLALYLNLHYDHYYH
jgi:hypothetical protein